MRAKREREREKSVSRKVKGAFHPLDRWSRVNHNLRERQGEEKQVKAAVASKITLVK